MPSYTVSFVSLVKRAVKQWDQLVVPFVFVVMVMVFFAIDSKTLSANNLTNVMTQVSILAVVTIGASLVVFSGGFDLSAGAVVALSSVAAAIIVEHTGYVSLGIATGIGCDSW